MKKKFSVRQSHIRDAESLSKLLRASDLEEILAYTGRPAKSELSYPVIANPKGTFSIVSPKGHIIGMFGVVPSRTKFVGRPWLMGAEDLFDNHTKQFVTECRPWIKRLGRDFLFLENYVLASNDKHIKWIKWAGFEFVEHIQAFGIARKPFWKFQKKMSEHS